MSNFKPCRRCYNSPIKGYIVTSIEGEDVLEECNCHILWREKEALNYNLSQANIPISELSLEDYVGEISLKEIDKLKKFINNFKEKGFDKSLYFYGDNGTQKTTVAQIVGKELLKQGVSVFYIPTMEQIVKNFGVFENQKTFEIFDFIEKATNSDLVIIDECFANKKAYSVSDYQINQLRSYLKTRLEVNRKSTIFISNFKVDQIEEQGFSKALQSLIQRNTLKGKVLTFKDYYFIMNSEFELDDIFE